MELIRAGNELPRVGKKRDGVLLLSLLSLCGNAVYSWLDALSNTLSPDEFCYQGRKKTMASSQIIHD